MCPRVVSTRTLEECFLAYREERDLAALAWGFDQVAPELLAVVRHLARGPVEAEDIVQETFVTAIERSAGWDAARQLVPWLVGIATNVARRRFEREARAPIVSDPLEPIESIEPNAAASLNELDSALEATGVDRVACVRRRRVVRHDAPPDQSVCATHG